MVHLTNSQTSKIQFGTKIYRLVRTDCPQQIRREGGNKEEFDRAGQISSRSSLCVHHNKVYFKPYEK